MGRFPIAMLDNPGGFQSLRHQVVRHILNDLERFGAKPIDFKAFLDIMTAKMGERDTKEDRKDLINHPTHTHAHTQI